MPSTKFTVCARGRIDDMDQAMMGAKLSAWCLQEDQDGVSQLNELEVGV